MRYFFNYHFEESERFCQNLSGEEVIDVSSTVLQRIEIFIIEKNFVAIEMDGNPMTQCQVNIMDVTGLLSLAPIFFFR